MVVCIDAGILSYSESLQWQKELSEKRRKEKIADHLLLLEHPPVYTMGRRDTSSDLLVSEEALRHRGMEFYKTDRGGRMTYHGPGQLVGYLIMKLPFSIPELVHRTEESLLRLLERFHVEGERDPDYPGIWIGHRKIAALGFHIDRGVTRHGFSLNINCDLRPFQNIHPCGISDRDVTSLEKEIGWCPSMRDVKQAFLEEFSAVFGMNVSVAGVLSSLPE